MLIAMAPGDPAVTHLQTLVAFAHQLNVDLRFSTRDDLAQADLQTTLNGLLARINALSDSIRQTYLEAL